MSRLVKLAVMAISLTFSTTSANEPDDSGYRVFDPAEISGTTSQYVSGGGSVRCTVKDCLCRVIPPKSKSVNATITGSSRRHSVYFPEGAYEISQSSSKEIKTHIDQFRSLKASYTVIGYTDDCGSHAYNLKLVKDRSKEVKAHILDLGIKSVELTIFRPESGSGHDPNSRRVDIIAHTSNRVTTMIEKIQADVYLVDGSGSMWTGWKDWTDVIAASFKPGSRVYLSKTLNCSDGMSMESVTPGGGTEIWYSYWKILEWMKPGETLAIISDFRSSVPLTKREALLIEQKVREKRVKVIAVSP